MQRTGIGVRQEKFEDYLILFEFGSGSRLDVEFEVIEIFGECVSPDAKEILYTVFTGNAWDGTPDIDKADTWLTGHIKWDGCSNWRFVEQERSMLHFCGKELAMGVGRLFGKMYEIAKREMGDNYFVED